jgi:hypothetical protein
MISDLHIHTENSDGTHTLKEIIQICDKLNTSSKLIGIADHHYLTVKKFMEINKNFFIIPGIEISAQTDFTSVHILGYSKNPKEDLDFVELNKKIVEGYNLRSRKILKQLEDKGYQLKNLKIRDSSLPDPIYTYDIAKALGKLIDIKNEREVIKWSRQNGNILFVEEDDFLPHPSEVIRILRQNNFKVVLAHPGTRFCKEGDITKFEGILRNFIDYGLEGLEVFYPKHTEKQVKIFSDLAKKYNLQATGGSDYHGKGRGIDSPMFLLDKIMTKSFLEWI